jgi:hypothetical protein
MPDTPAQNAGAQAGWPGIRHSYPLAVRDHGLATALGLLLRSLSYALARFAVLLASALACIVWAMVAFGGAAWLGTHVASAFGIVWLLVCVVGIGWFWASVLRYALHLIGLPPVWAACPDFCIWSKPAALWVGGVKCPLTR